MDHSRRNFLRLSGTLPILGLGGAGGCANVVRGDEDDEKSGEWRAEPPFFVGENRQLFLDDTLVSRWKNVRLKVHEPTRCPEVLVWDKPWEGSSSTYGSVLYDEKARKYLMYYLGAASDNEAEVSRHPSCICVMESDDGIHWTRPVLGVEFNGITQTNILFSEMEDFNPFIDRNPDAKPEERFKAICVYRMFSLFAWSSPDGIHWTKMNGEDAVFTDGRFDSQNVGFWSEAEKCYVLYFRDARRDARDVGRAVSDDFIHWRRDGFIEFPKKDEGPRILGQFYTNQIQPYYRAPEYYLGFPARYVDRGPTVSTLFLPEGEERRKRGNINPRYETALTDSVYIVSRDGRNFRQSPDVFLKPGLKTKHNWGYGDNYIAHGILETDSTFDDQPREMTLYATESRFTGMDAFWRRYTLRIDGFASLAAESKKGFVETKPILFHGTELSLNASTSALGFIRVEFREPGGGPIPGFSASDCDIIYGDSVDRAVTWQNDRHVCAFEKRPVVVRFYMKEADIYSMRFRYGDSTTRRS